MYLIRNKDTKVVKYLFNQDPVVDTYLVDPIKAFDIMLDTHEILEVSEGPEYWQGNLWKYDNEWIVADEGMYNELLTQEKENLNKNLSLTAKQYLSNAMSDYSEWEAISWPILIAEATQYKIDGTIGEYMLAEIGGKYPTAEDLADILLQRKEGMKLLRANVVLNRQNKEALIDEAKTFKDLESININDGWEL